MTQRRQSILKAAETLLSRYGYAKTTVADVAREADIGVGTVYLEFKGKDSIVEALTKRYRDEILDVLAAIASDESLSHSERLTKFLVHRHMSISDFAERGHHALDMISCVCPASAQAVGAHFEAEVTLLAELVLRGEAAGELSSPSAKLEAEALLRVSDMYAPGGTHPELFEERVAALELMVRGLGKS
ncbi:MAG: AcrR family transcriptional regulator [Bradymonadia bacterium]|jgi:AcrR family transcriptional regulator